MKSLLSYILVFALLVVVISVGYYYVIALPKNNSEKLIFEKQKYQDELSARKIESDNKIKQDEVDLLVKQGDIAKNVKDDCIDKISKSVYFDFSDSTVNSEPLFYPYEDESSFNKNERLVTALSAYSSCITGDPRYDENNQALRKIGMDGINAWMVIRKHITTVKKKRPSICGSSLLSKPAKIMCDEIYIGKE